MTLTSILPPRVESPCIRVCKLDAHNVCEGCGRTVAEIADWSRLSDDEQRTVCAHAALRMARRDADRRS